MKLEVGIYVRTDKVGIKKIYEIDNNKTKYKYLYKLKNQDDDGCIDLGALCENNIIKASYDIIDLIEVGDYVNGEKVLCTNCKLEYIDDDSETGVNEVANGLELETGWIYFEHEVQSILTKEMFDNAKYCL